MGLAPELLAGNSKGCRAVERSMAAMHADPSCKAIGAESQTWMPLNDIRAESMVKVSVAPSLASLSSCIGTVHLVWK